MTTKKKDMPYFIYVRLNYKWRWAQTSYGKNIYKVKKDAANHLLHYYEGATGVKITRRHLMEYEELVTLMRKRNFSVQYRNTQKSYTCFSNEEIPMLSCDVFLESKQFEFKFVTKRMHILHGGNASPVDNDKHFEKMLDRFMLDVELLLCEF